MTHSYFNDNLAERDPLIFKALQDEKKRQQGQIELIASENSVSFASLEAIGSSSPTRPLKATQASVSTAALISPTLSSKLPLTAQKNFSAAAS